MSIFGVFLTVLTIYLSVIYKTSFPQKIIGKYVLTSMIFIQVVCHVVSGVILVNANKFEVVLFTLW